MDLSKAEYHLFLVAGQSNSQGYLGPNNEGLNEPIPVLEPATVFYFNAKSNEILDASRATKADYVGAEAGFHNRFAIDYHKATGKKVIFIHEVHGNSGVVSGITYGGGNWPDTYRSELRKKYEAFKTAATKSPTFSEKWGLAGLIWGQGEAEVGLLENKSKTLAELESALSSLFDSFVQDYGHDYAGKPDSLIKVVLVSIFAYPAMTSDRFYPDSPEWAASRDMQRHVAVKHPDARMVYFAIEKIFNETVWQPNNAVHYTQKQYNEIGRVMAQEIAKPGSTIQEPKAVESLTATPIGAWRIDLRWTPPAGGIPGELPCYRIYRRKQGETAWNWIWQTASAPEDALHDENGLNPDASYEYRVGSRNEFAEVFSEVAQATTGPLRKDTVAEYLKLAAPVNAPAVKLLWKELTEGGHTHGLRSLHLLTKETNSESGKVFNLVREDDERGRFDIADPGKNAFLRETSGYEFRTPAEATTATALIPTYGPFTFMIDLAWIQFPEGSEPYGFMSQGRGYPAPPEQSRSMFFFGPEKEALSIYHEDQINMFKFTGVTPALGRGDLYALTYDGKNLAWQRAGSKPKVHENSIYFFNIQDTPFSVHTMPSSSPAAAFRLSYLAVWNRALDQKDSAAVHALIKKHLTLAK